MSQQEIEEVIKGVVNGDAKKIGPVLYVTLALTIGGWVYQIGISNAQQATNTQHIKENKNSIEIAREKLPPISEDLRGIKTDVQYLKRDINDIKTQMRIDKAEILEAIKLQNGNGIMQ